MNYRRKIRLFCLALGGTFLLGNCASQTDATGKETHVLATTDEVGEAGASIEITSGSGVAIPPGALAVGVDVTVATVDVPAELNIGGVGAASKPIEVFARDSSGNPIDTVATPMTISLALDSAATLALAEPIADNLCVLLKSRSAGLFVWRRSSIVLNETQAKASVQSLYFGVFHLVYCGQTDLAGFVDAADQGLAKESVVAVIPSTAPKFGHTHVCAGVMRIEEANDCEDDCRDQFKLTMLGSASAEAVSSGDQKLTFDVAPEAFVDGKEVFFGFAFTKSGQCPFQRSTITVDDTEKVEAMFAYRIEKQQIVSGLTATFGTAPFATTTTKVTVGAEDGRVMAEPQPTLLCLESDTESTKTWLSTDILSDGSVSGDMEKEWVLATADDAETSHEVSVRMGSECTGIIANDLVPNPATGIGYHAEFEFSRTKTIYLAPVTLSLNQTAFAVFSSQNGCLRIYEEGKMGPDGDGPVAATVLHLGTESFSLVLPYLTNSAGEPVYDMSIDVLDVGVTTCDGETLQTFEAASRPLNADITIPE